MENSKSEASYSNLDIPYNKVAKEALVKWNHLPEEEAIKIIEEQSFEEVEKQANAKGSMEHAVEAIGKNLQLTDEEVKNLKDDVFYGKNNGKSLQVIYDKIQEKNLIPNEVVMDTVFTVHDEWVKEHEENFDKPGREKNHQMMPSELCGLEEAKSDLLFINSIFEAANIKVDEKSFEETYNNRVRKFIHMNEITNTDGLINYITSIDKKYPPLAEYSKENLAKFKDPEFVRKHIIPNIEEKGIGKAEDVFSKYMYEMDKAYDKREILGAKILENTKTFYEAKDENSHLKETLEKYRKQNLEKDEPKKTNPSNPSI